MLLSISIVVNLGFLGFFKYYNFFLENFTNAFTFLGYHFSASSLKIVLPVGISFYTFQTMSYSIDVFRKKMEPTNDFIAFLAFVSFFPQLVAGPIERATNLLPQFYKRREFNYDKAVDGMRQILWGLFKKIVIADSCAVYVNKVFANHLDYPASALVFGVLLFAFQIYGDFSGYSDIAIGTARLFGFSLMRNFAFPYFSRDIAEFWRRWHISLSTWFRDYLYIPLGGSRGSMLEKIRNTFIIFIVSGFWHGANWTFIIWGALNAVYFLPLLLTKKNRMNLNIVAEGKHFPSIKELFYMFFTFALTLFAWIFFRAENLSQAISYVGNIFSFSLFDKPNLGVFNITFILVSFLFVEWFQRGKQHGLEFAAGIPKLVRWGSYTFIIYVILLNLNFYSAQEFIYFQF